MPHVLITGATGFIGSQLVKRLSEQGCEITCLVRGTSNLQSLESVRPRIVTGDVNDPSAVRQAVKSVDMVYHLAGRTKALHAHDFFTSNEAGTRCLAAACGERTSPPLLVYVSSIAAAGPSRRGRPRTEASPSAPISQYGRSKRAAELALAEVAHRLPITIVRPPIVLGPGDRTGLAMFQSIAQFGVHFVPGYAEADMSIIHVDDLVAALQAVSKRGQRITSASDTTGIYFAAADEVPSYATLGKWIGQALGRKWTAIVPIPGLAIRSAALVNEVVGRCLGTALYLNWDKSREALAGSWHCSTETLHRDTDFTLPSPLPVRLAQTAEWYIEQAWLKSPRSQTRYRGSSMAQQ